MKLGPHLHRIGNDMVAAYLVDAEDGITVIDAGLPGHWKEFLAELDAMGRSVSDVRGVILTHGDSDHLGFAERLRRLQGIPVFVHGADAARARGTTRKPKVAVGPVRLRPVAGFLIYSLGKRAWRPVYLTEVTEVADGDVLALPGSPRIIGVPGHSPGSIAVHVPVADAVFVGDAITMRSVLTGRTGLQPPLFTEDPAQALDSLGRLAGVQATWVLPGHGAPWRGNPASVQETVRAAALDNGGGPGTL